MDKADVLHKIISILEKHLKQDNLHYIFRIRREVQRKYIEFKKSACQCLKKLRVLDEQISVLRRSSLRLRKKNKYQNLSV